VTASGRRVETQLLSVAASGLVQVAHRDDEVIDAHDADTLPSGASVHSTGEPLGPSRVHVLVVAIPFARAPVRGVARLDPGGR
jgi:hypothetical protein